MKRERNQRVEPRRPEDVKPGAKRSADIPDAIKGRQYQGTGIANRRGRFGSSETPADLERKPARRTR